MKKEIKSIILIEKESKKLMCATVPSVYLQKYLIRRSQVSLFLLIELFPISINKETVDILEDPGASKHKKA